MIELSVQRYDTEHFLLIFMQFFAASEVWMFALTGKWLVYFHLYRLSEVCLTYVFFLF